VRDDHPELRRDHIEPLRGLLADPMHGRTAARAIDVFRFDCLIDPRQMTRQRAAIGAPLFRPRLCGRRVGFVGRGFVRRNRLLGVLDRQKQLIGVELLGVAAELRPLQLPQQVTEVVVL
jgi:hypothetical protein